jgi:replicative DNA helicase
MNPYSKVTELKILLTSLQNEQPRLRSLTLSEAQTEYFGNAHAAEIRRRMEVLLKKGKTLGNSAEDWLDEPGLSQDARDFLKGASKKILRESRRYSKERIAKLLHNLQLRYRLRAALKGTQAATALLQGKVGETELEAWNRQIQQTLEQVKLSDERSEKLTLGWGQSNAAINQLVKRYTKKRSGQLLTFGMPVLDQYYDGPRRGNVVTFSANSSGAKSAMALNCAINQVEAGFNVCYCSMEMDNDENMHRLIANRAKMDHGVVQVQERGFSTKQKSKISKAIKGFHRRAKKHKSRLTLWDVQDSSFTPQQLEIEAKPYGYDVIYVDYITLFGSPFHSETWKLHLEYSRFLKGMAKRLNCVVVILAQLGDDKELRYGKAIRDNTDYWFYWTYGPDEEEAMQTTLETGKARNHKRRHCLLDMSQLNNMIITAISEDLPDDSALSYRDSSQMKERPKKREKLLGRKKRPNRREVSKELGFNESTKKRKKGGGRRRQKRDIDGA